MLNTHKLLVYISESDKSQHLYLRQSRSDPLEIS